MQPTDTEPLTLEKFNQQHASLVAKAEAIRNRRDANLVEAAAALNARYGGNETPKTLLTRIAQSLPDIPYRPNPKAPPTEETTAPDPTPYETLESFADRVITLNPDGPISRHKARAAAELALKEEAMTPADTTMQKLHPTTIHGAVTQIVAQPGDGTRYRIILTECPVDYLGETPQHLLSAMTGDKGRSMFITMGYKYIRDGGFYLAPTYVEEKFGPDSTYLSNMVAHLMNLLFSKPYIKVLKNLLAGPADERHSLPPVFQTDEAIKAEIANPHAIWNSPAE